MSFPPLPRVGRYLHTRTRRKDYTENPELVVSRSLGSRAQIYVVPTASFNDRELVQGGLLSSQIPDLPGVNVFSIGIGAASFGVQKEIYRRAFTLRFSTSPGTTVSQRASTRATFLGEPNADTPAGLFIGFDLTRQIH